MGDRGNIVIQEENGGIIYLYTHWHGAELPQILREALKRGEHRWDDEAYLTRIIFSEMIQNNILGETGYGISTYQLDWNHPDLEVSVKNQTVTINGNVKSFKDYIKEGK